MKKLFIDVDVKNLPMSYIKWSKIEQSTENKPLRYVKTLNDFKDYPYKFYKKIL